MTQWRTLIVRTVAPLALAATRAVGYRHETMTHIPGSTVRGALAARYLQSGEPEGDTMTRLFDAMRCAPLHSTGDSHARPFTLPLSTRTCGLQPGLRSSGGHGMVDTLILAAVDQLAQRAGAEETPVLPPRTASRTCPKCQAERRPRRPLQPVSGTAIWTEAGALIPPAREEEHIERSIDGATRASQGTLHVHRALATNQRFAARVAFDSDDALAIVTGQLAPAGSLLWAGSGRSRGYGGLEVEQWEHVAPGDSVGHRQSALQTALEATCSRRSLPAPERRYAAITVQSHTISRDAFGRFCTSMTPSLLASWLGLDQTLFEVVQQYGAVAPIEGWNAALGVPKGDALAIGAGSTCLLTFSPEHLDLVLPALERAEVAGIGERRGEGFGIVSVCDPVHWQLNELELE